MKNNTDVPPEELVRLVRDAAMPCTGKGTHCQHCAAVWGPGGFEDVAAEVLAGRQRDIETRQALSAGNKLLALADWFDAYDKKRGFTADAEVQRDLRRWGNAALAAMGKEATE